MNHKKIFYIIATILLHNYFQTLPEFKLSIPTNQSEIIVKKGNIIESNVDIIVNAANEELAGGAGVCGAIFTASGWDKLQTACNQYPEINSIRCPTGQARVTDSFDLKKQNIKYIIHAVGPDCRIIKNKEKQDKLLKDAYINSLKLAETLPVKSIAFPFISSAIYAFPKERAAQIALQSIYDYFQENKKSKIKEIQFVLFSPSDFNIFFDIAKNKNLIKKD